MLLLVGGVIMLVVVNVMGHNGVESGNGRRRQIQEYEKMQKPALSNTYKDIFVPGLGGRPTLGTTAGTCWARGGICVDIKNCPNLRMDVGVPGCSWGYKVCCIIHTLTSPTVGVIRRNNIPILNDLKELGAPLEIIALRNSILFSNWHSSKPDSEEIIRYDLLN